MNTIEVTDLTKKFGSFTAVDKVSFEEKKARCLDSFAFFIYRLSSLGMDLFVSTVSKTQHQAMMVAMFGILMPMNFLSGFAFPIDNMPSWIQPITYLIPLRYYITIIRGVILKGDGLFQLIPETVTLAGISFLILAASVMRFSKRLE